MRITSRFTIAAHIIMCVSYFEDKAAVTSSFLAGSIGANPVIVRTLMGQLKDAGIISISQGKTGIALARPLNKITFYDIYNALGCVDEGGLFRFHESPNPKCPVGRNIHRSMEGFLADIQRSFEERMKSITAEDLFLRTESAITEESEKS